MPDHGPVSRREFLRRGVVVGAGVAAAGSLAPAFAAGRAKVVVVTCPDAVAENDKADANAVRRMLDRGITTLAGKRDVRQAWQTFIRKTDKVALVDSGTWLLNIPDVPAEVLRGLALAGPAQLTFTWCSLAQRNKAYVDALTAGVKRVGQPVEVMDGSIYTVPGHFHEHPFNVIVMTPTLKSHSIAGVSGVIKHYATMGREHVKEHHPNGMETCGSVVGGQFKDHRHLVIVDALRWGRGQAGPGTYAKMLILGTDPVATDVVALEYFLKSEAPFRDIPPAYHRQLAGTRYHGGISDRARIDVTEVKV